MVVTIAIVAVIWGVVAKLSLKACTLVVAYGLSCAAVALVRVFSWVEARDRARANVAALAIVAIAAIAVVAAIATVAVAIASVVVASTVVAAGHRATGAGSGCTVSYRARGNGSSTIISIGSDTMVFMVASCWGSFGAELFTNFS